MSELLQLLEAARLALAQAQGEAEAMRQAHADANAAAWGAHHAHQDAVAATEERQAELEALLALQVAADGLEG